MTIPERKRCMAVCCHFRQQRILTETSRQMLRSEAKSPSERKEPPTPKKPPIKEPKKVKKPIGDPPPKRAPKRVGLQGLFSGLDMARYLARSCPRRNGYLGIVLREPGRNVPLQAVNGHCLGCGYRMSWIVVRGGQSSYGVRRRSSEAERR